MKSELITIPAAAKIAGICEQSMRHLARTGDLPTIRIGRSQLRVSVAALERWLTRGGEKTA